jgi:bacillithiol biosynthesis deacetylase BshB1
MKLDALVVAAHPDDAEISVGGTLLRLVDAGKRVGIVDVTRGEMGSRGTQAERDAETAAASALIGVSMRTNLGAPDGRVQVTVLVPVVWRLRFAARLCYHALYFGRAHHELDPHPDHVASGRLAREAWYLSGLRRLAPAGTQARRPKRLLSFLSHTPFEPTFVVDVTPVWERKVELVRCYSSQLEPESADDKGEHFLYGADILRRMETKARTWGERIGVRWGEPLLAHGPIPVGAEGGDVERLF